MNITLNNSGASNPVTVPEGSYIAHVRGLTDDLEIIGAPSNYTFAVNGDSVADDYLLKEGDIVTFRPKSASKG